MMQPSILSSILIATAAFLPGCVDQPTKNVEAPGQPAAAEFFERIEGYVGERDSTIRRLFGVPDEVGHERYRDAVIWTYVVQGEGEADKVAGSWQFAFWNGRVAALNVLDYTPQADSLYEAALTFLKKGGSTIGRGPVSIPDRRLTRRGDNLWQVDVLRSELQPAAMIRVGDAGYGVCRKNLAYEAARVQAKFGIELERRSSDTDPNDTPMHDHAGDTQNDGRNQ